VPSQGGGMEKTRSRSLLGSHLLAGSLVNARSWVHAVRSVASMTMAHQILFWSNPCSGRLVALHS